LDSLSADEKRDWERHFQECATCRAAQVELERLFNRMKIQEPQPLSSDLAPKVLAQIPASDWQRPAPTPVPRPNFGPGRWPGSSPAARGDNTTRPLFPGFTSAPFKIAATMAILAGLAILALFSFHRNQPAGTPDSLLVAHPAQPAPLRPNDTGTPTPLLLRHSLDWLQTAQEPNGRWDAQTWGAQPQFGIGVSALALLALIHKEPHVFQSPYAENVRRGVSHLISTMSEDGLMGPALSGATYNQGLATLALLEAQSRENHPEWKAAGDRAVQWLIRAQHPDGGWGYIAGDTPNSSATIWPLQALIRAEGEGFAETRPAVERGLNWLAQSVTTSGELAYHSPQQSSGSPTTLTAAGAVCFLLQRDARTVHPMARRLLAALRRLVPGEQTNSEPNYYQQYFVGKAFELATDAETVQRLTAGENRWLTCQVASGPQAGSWDAVDPWGGIGGRVYSTALASLALPDR
jgi:hypothetical protein